MPSATLLGQSVLSGIFIGSLYGLLGLGLSLSWGMLRQVNLAHFALAFLGGYVTFSSRRWRRSILSSRWRSPCRLSSRSAWHCTGSEPLRR